MHSIRSKQPETFVLFTVVMLLLKRTALEKLASFENGIQDLEDLHSCLLSEFDGDYSKVISKEESRPITKMGYDHTIIVKYYKFYGTWYRNMVLGYFIAL